jgi:hypothetical protein
MLRIKAEAVPSVTSSTGNGKHKVGGKLNLRFSQHDFEAYHLSSQLCDALCSIESFALSAGYLGDYSLWLLKWRQFLPPEAGNTCQRIVSSKCYAHFKPGLKHHTVLQLHKWTSMWELPLYMGNSLHVRVWSQQLPVLKPSAAEHVMWHHILLLPLQSHHTLFQKIHFPTIR